MKDNGGFENTNLIPDDTAFKEATDKLNAELEQEGIAESDNASNELDASEEVNQEEQKEKEAAFAAPPKRNGEQRRLRKQLDQQAQIIAHKEAEIERLRQKVGDSEHVTIETAKHALEVKQYALKEKLAEAFKEAKETDDYSKVSELTSALSEVNTAYSQLKNQKPSDEQPYYQPQYPAFNQQEDDYVHPFDEWIENNQWYLKNDVLRAAADEIYLDWKARLDANDRSDLTESYAFYDEVGKAVKSRFNISPADKNAQRERVQEEVPAYGGASHLNGAYKGNSPKGYPPLTLQEKELAHTMPISKTNAEKEELFKKMKYSTEKEIGKEPVKNDRYY